MNNQFQDFSNRMIAKHKGFGQTFDSAPMVFPEQESAGETGGTSIENHYIKNLYQIQNLTEENHLYHQNLRFVTNILEKKLEQRVVPSVEKLVERTIQEELPGVEKQIVHEMAERLHTLVKEGGVKELTMLREQLYKETERQKEQLYKETERQSEQLYKETERQKEQLYKETERQKEQLYKETEVRTEKLAEKLEREFSVEQNRHTEITNLTEQEILLRKIENIYYSSTQNHFYGNAEQAGEQTENSPERTKVWTRELQTQVLQTPTLQTSASQTPTLETQKAPRRSFDFLHLEYGEFDMLFTGDVEKEGEERLTEILGVIQEEKGITWEILKTAHHGSKNSTTETFLQTVHPQYAWISAGRKNRYGHPHDQTLKRLEKSGAKIYSTQNNGAVAVTVRKKTMWIHGGNS